MVNRPLLVASIVSLIVAAGAAREAVAQTPLGTAFTYQGRLDLNGSPVTGPAQVKFTLWDSLTDGTQIGPVSSHDVLIDNGLFTVSPDFGAVPFNGQSRFIQIIVEVPSQPTPITLSPRQPLTATPYALQTRGINVDDAGRVGIGDVASAERFRVVDNTGATAISGSVGEAGAFAIRGQNVATGATGFLGYGNVGLRAVGALGGYAGQFVGDTVFVSGNVGIGTSTPTQAKLEIVGTTTGIHVTAEEYGIFATAIGDGIPLSGSSISAPAVLGTSIDAPGVQGVSNIGNGVQGNSTGEFGGGGTFPAGVAGSGRYYGVYGETTGFDGTGVYGRSTAGGGVGVEGFASGSGSVAIEGRAGSFAKAGLFRGSVDVTGTLTKSGGSFRIDHPLDPANKFLSHSFVESPDMMNVYNGNVVTDAAGYATIAMPDWFQALNRDFRYQLTVIDTTNSNDFVQAKVVGAMNANQFTLRTSRPHTTVSWQVTGIRQDPWANANRIPVEQAKPDHERGRYLTPREYGMPEQLEIDYDRSKVGRTSMKK